MTATVIVRRDPVMTILFGIAFLLGVIIATVISVSDRPTDAPSRVQVTVTVNPVPVQTCFVDEYQENRTVRRAC